MNKVELNKAQIIALVVTALVLTYFLTGVLTFALNHAIKMLKSNWTWDFTFVALINGYPQAYKALAISLVLSFSAAFIVPYIPKKEKLYGDAKFATSADVRKAGLFPKMKRGTKEIDKTGIIIGKWGNQLLRFYGQQFVALGAPSRSGKGVGIVVPNLLDFENSIVAQDIKLELYEMTSKYRREVLGQEVFLFNPFSKNTHRWNPLHYIDIMGSEADSELTKLGDVLYPLKGDGSVTDYFNGKAKNLFIGLCYLMGDLLNTRRGLLFMQAYQIEASFTLYAILNLSTGLNFELEETENGEKKLVDNFADTYNILLSMNMVNKKAKERIDTFMAIKSENEQSSALGSFQTPLDKFKEDNVRYATSGNDFDLRDLRKKKMTIYVGITPDNLNPSTGLLLNLFWQQVILVNIAMGKPDTNKELKHSTLFLMDEFTASRYLGIYSYAISFMAGYMLRSLIIFQDKAQLYNHKPDGYGQHEAKTLLANHACQIFYAPKNDEDAKELSTALGTKTVSNISRNIGSGGGGSRSETSRALMLPQELKTMSLEKEIILIDNVRPILCNKAYYYNDSYFVDKLREVSPSLRAIKGMPNKDDFEAAYQRGETKIDIPLQTKEKLDEELRAQMEFKFANLINDKEDTQNIQEIEEMIALLDKDLEDFDEEEYKNFENNERIENE